MIRMSLVESNELNDELTSNWLVLELMLLCCISRHLNRFNIHLRLRYCGQVEITRRRNFIQRQ